LGLNKVAGKVFRIGHLGNLNEVTFISQILWHVHVVIH
jgi:aspartate aminotransferase-like enzyme